MSPVTFQFHGRDRTIPAAEAVQLQVDLAAMTGPAADAAWELARKLETVLRQPRDARLDLSLIEERALLDVLDRYDVECRLTTTLQHLQMALNGERAPKL